MKSRLDVAGLLLASLLEVLVTMSLGFGGSAIAAT